MPGLVSGLRPSPTAGPPGAIPRTAGSSVPTQLAGCGCPPNRHRCARRRRCGRGSAPAIDSGSSRSPSPQPSCPADSGVQMPATVAHREPVHPLAVAQESRQRKRLAARGARKPLIFWWPRAELNHRHKDFQGETQGIPRLPASSLSLGFQRVAVQMSAIHFPDVPATARDFTGQLHQDYTNTLRP